MTTYVAESELELGPPVDGAKFRQASEWLAELGGKQGVPGDHIARLDLCLNEALANIVDHGGSSVPGSPIHLRFNITHLPDIHQASVTIIDSGIKFDLLAAVEKPKPTMLEEAQVGGLGIMMIRN